MQTITDRTDKVTRQRSPPAVGDVTIGQAREALSWFGSYLLRGFSRDPASGLCGTWQPGQLMKAVGPLPEQGRPLLDALRLFESEIAPGLLRWNHPRFTAYFATSSPFPSIIAEALASAHNSNLMLASTSPAGAELDLVVGRWYRDLLNIPAGLAPQFYASASQSLQHALVAAINQKTDGLARHRGLACHGRFRIYTSELGHFLARKNAIAAGLGEESVRSIPVDDAGAMRPDMLDASAQRDKSMGVDPLMAIATLGTTAITSVDPVKEIAEVSRRHSMFCYVDAAYGGAFSCLPEYRWVTDGWDLVDAICINPHKALFVPLGCSLLFLRDRSQLRRACCHGGDYLPESDEASADPMDYTLLCSRRLNTLASFFNLATFGAEGIRQRLRHLVNLARQVAKGVESEPMFQLLAHPLFTTVCFTISAGSRFEAAENRALALEIAHAIEETDKCRISTAKYRNQTWLRVSLGNINTSKADADFILSEIRAAWKRADQANQRYQTCGQ